jgi:CRISPR/Cas system CSM-associated protein Csm3 (group 7 of RAMP superfamily)
LYNKVIRGEGRKANKQEVNTLERVSGEAKMLRLTKYLTKKSIFKTEMIFTIFVSKEFELTSISKRDDKGEF